MTPDYAKQRAFTLVEVLIASSILFLVISLTVLGFNASRQQATLAASRISMHQPLEIIIDQVEHALRPFNEAMPNGSGQFGEVQYRWVAQEHSRHEAPIFLSDSEGTPIETAPAIFVLFNIQIELAHGNARRHYQYQKLGWEQ